MISEGSCDIEDFISYVILYSVIQLNFQNTIASLNNLTFCFYRLSAFPMKTTLIFPPPCIVDSWGRGRFSGSHCISVCPSNKCGASAVVTAGFKKTSSCRNI